MVYLELELLPITAYYCVVGPRHRANPPSQVQAQYIQSCTWMARPHGKPHQIFNFGGVMVC